MTRAAILRSVLRLPSFWALCSCSLLVTAVREALKSFMVSYLEQQGATAGVASMASSAMSAAGVVSIVATGVIVDVVPGSRGAVLPAMLVPMCAAVATLAFVEDVRWGRWWLCGVAAVRRA